MTNFDIIAQVTLENRFVAERRADETFEQAVLRQINAMSAAEGKKLFTSGKLSTSNVNKSPTTAILLIFNEKLDPDYDIDLLNDIVNQNVKKIDDATVTDP